MIGELVQEGKKDKEMSDIDPRREESCKVFWHKNGSLKRNTDTG